jgi:16S rRNA (cytidine1402-2'-O)-methyltransferase
MAKPAERVREERGFMLEGRTVAAPALAPGLHVVATPIGNLGDITLRALRTLAGADFILCEDTRVTVKLTRHFGIAAPLRPYHDHNAARVRPAIVEALRKGAAVALVSDAGTPLVSDPGFKLVEAAIAEAVPVEAVPGASAALAALTVSGLPSDRFLFAGFLPSRAGARREALDALAAVPASLIFYESPKRLAASLQAMAEILGDRPAAVARELTKRHEETRRGRLSALAAEHAAEQPPRGEIVVVVGPPEPAVAPTGDALDALLIEALASAPVKQAAGDVAAATGVPRRELYARALALKGADGRRR